LSAAAAFSLFIYLEYFGVQNRAIVSISAFYAFYRMLLFGKKELFVFGFFVGLFWFYWIGLSFRYVDMAYAIPFVMIGIAFIAGALFWILGFVKIFYLRAAVILFYFDIAQPFGFEWLKPELLLENSFFGSDKLSFGLFLASVTIFIYFQKSRLKTLFFIPLVFALNLSSHQKNIDKEIALIRTDYDQEYKWKRENLKTIIEENFAHIDMAIKESKKIVVLPESVFPMYLNRYPEVIERLLEKSKEITIIAGALYTNGQKHFNSTYFFSDSKMIVAHKVVLVPFGESTDFLPESIGRFINKIFFDGAEDYRTASKPTDFKIGDTLYRNAICYEATAQKMFKESPANMIAISNNAWYDPSIEPGLQRLVIRFFARKYGVTVYHSVNKSPSEVIY